MPGSFFDSAWQIDERSGNLKKGQSVKRALLSSILPWMRILYGVVGEGMGHATRSAVVLGHLLERGHEVRVVVSGKAHDFLVEKLRPYPKAVIEEIRGFQLRYVENRLDRKGSLFWNLRNAPGAIRRNVKVYRKVAEEGFRPELVMSDFESWAALYALNRRVPVISIDNIQILNRCRDDKAITKTKTVDFRLARLAVKMKVPGAYHYLVTSFFFPPVRKKRTTLVPPILRPEVLAARREPGEHVLVYMRAAEQAGDLPAMLKKLPYRFRLYGGGSEGAEGNVSLRSFSDVGFLEDLRTARAVIAGGGFSLMGEAVTLGVPMLSVPIEGQFEQELNARYLERLGYGVWSHKLTREAITTFLERTDELAQNLADYPRQDNTMTFACLDELIACRAAGKKRPKRLKSAAMGKWKDS